MRTLPRRALPGPRWVSRCWAGSPFPRRPLSPAEPSPPDLPGGGDCATAGAPRARAELGPQAAAAAPKMAEAPGPRSPRGMASPGRGLRAARSRWRRGNPVSGPIFCLCHPRGPRRPVWALWGQLGDSSKVKAGFEEEKN